MLRHIVVRCRSPLVAVSLLVAAPAAAQAADATGGAAAVERPEVARVACATTNGATCVQGDTLKVQGAGLDAADAVVFMGGRSPRDDRRAKPRTRRFHSLTVRIPPGAKSGPVRVASRQAGRSAPTPPVEVVDGVDVAPTQALLAAAPAGAFPVAGPHQYGTDVNTFGGGRGHKGQDVLADCGTPVVAAVAGTVKVAKFESRAGYFAVVSADDGTSQAYLHMRRPATVAKGDRVEAGQQIGEVGETGRADGCHLHFELWTAPGWYEGGEPVDPLPFLRRLDTTRYRR